MTSENGQAWMSYTQAKRLEQNRKTWRNKKKTQQTNNQSNKQTNKQTNKKQQQQNPMCRCGRQSSDVVM